jgi:hypothetical protein
MCFPTSSGSGTGCWTFPIGTGEIDLEVCAGSFAEFLYRFWIENEIHFATRRGQALNPAAAAYAARLLRPAGT